GRVFEASGVWRPRKASITGLAEPEEVDTIDVTVNVLPALGVSPATGRAGNCDPHLRILEDAVRRRPERVRAADHRRRVGVRRHRRDAGVISLSDRTRTASSAAPA